MAKESKLDELVARLRKAEIELAEEADRLFEAHKERLRYTVRNGKVEFEEAVKELQRRYRVGAWQYLREAKLRYVLSAPLIYAMIVPLAFLDLSLTLYQHICFRLYAIPRVKRADYMVIDRHMLGYLNGIEKLNCVYCGYSNGVIAYGREIAARTEQFWCPIKHAKRVKGDHARVKHFLEYGDAEAWRLNREQKKRES